MQTTMHAILTLKPDAQFDWDRCTLRDPLSTDHPSLAQLVQDAIGETSGQFLVAVELKVTILEQAPLPETSIRPSAPTSTADTEPALNHDATEPVSAV